jgi:hypothetical protein
VLNSRVTETRDTWTALAVFLIARLLLLLVGYRLPIGT